MPLIFLRPVTAENKQACLELSLSREQKAYIPDVASSLQMAEKFPHACLLAIYDAHEKIVGFSLYGIDEKSSHFKLYRLMIDRTEQHRGLGKAAALEIIKTLKKNHEAKTILVTYHHDNIIARKLYTGLGFMQYDRKNPSILARLDFKGNVR